MPIFLRIFIGQKSNFAWRGPKLRFVGVRSSDIGVRVWLFAGIRGRFSRGS